MSQYRCPTCGGPRRRRQTQVPVGDGPPTPTSRSVFALVQEELRGEPWQLLVASVLLNRCRGRTVRRLLLGDPELGPALFERWPSARKMLQATHEEVALALRPLGLQNRRADTLMALAEGWVDLEADHGPRVPAELVAELSGVGQYVLDSYRIFVEPGRLIPPVSGDERLAAYVTWAIGCQEGKPT